MPWRNEFPFRPQFFAGPKGRQHYVDEGPRDGGPTVVCVHGNPTWAFYYRRLIHALSPAYRCLAIDHLGCGLSERPKNFDYRLRSHVDNLVAWIDALELRDIVLVVHDWGGAIGLSAALERIDRLRGLCVLNTAAFPPPFIPWRIAACRTPLLGSWAIRYANAFARAALWMAVEKPDSLSPSARAGLLFPYGSPADRRGIDGFVRDIPLHREHPTYAPLERLESRLSELSSLEIALVWGMKDWCFRPECLDRLLQAWPDAHVQRLEQVGHYVMEEAPEAVIDAVSGIIQRSASRV